MEEDEHVKGGKKPLNFVLSPLFVGMTCWKYVYNDEIGVQEDLYMNRACM